LSQGRSSPQQAAGHPGEGEGINHPRGKINIHPSLFLGNWLD